LSIRRTLLKIARPLPGIRVPTKHLSISFSELRSHLVDSQNVVAIWRRYGVSRQTFYNGIPGAFACYVVH
jgi:hypothetical protein